MPASSISLPWLNIPKTAQPGQLHAFTDREAQLAQLYLGLVETGNAVRRGVKLLRHQVLVSGYMGVGKSALILQALYLLRGELRPEKGLPPIGQRWSFAQDTPYPENPEKWIVLRFSGKQIVHIDLLSDEICKAVIEEKTADQAARTGGKVPSDFLLQLFDDFAVDAGPQVAQALPLTLLHRLLRTTDAKAYAAIHAALDTLVETIRWIKRWRGSKLTETLKTTQKIDKGTDIEAKLLAQVGQKPSDLNPIQKASLSLAANSLYKNASSLESTTSVDKTSTVDVQLTVDLLNDFFRATEAANLPTILVLDDLDEFASTAGPSHDNRARVLSWILGPILKLRPTFLILALRGEYVHEDLLRSMAKCPVPPMKKRDVAPLVEAWCEVQTPAVPPDAVKRLVELALQIVAPFADEDLCVIPARLLEFVVWRANQLRLEPARSSPRPPFELLSQFIEENFGSSAVRAVLRLVNSLDPETRNRCVASEPVAASELAIPSRDRKELEKVGLLRPALAGDADADDIVIDPLCGYLHAAQKTTA